MKFLLILSIIVFLSCTDKTRIPNGIISKQKMEKILWDMIQADRFSSQYLKKDSATKNIKLENLKLYEQIFQIHGTSKEEFAKSFRFYLNRPDITKTIFDSLAAKANRRKEESYKSLK